MAISMSSPHFGTQQRPKLEPKRIQAWGKNVNDARKQLGLHLERHGLTREQKVINWLVQRGNAENKGSRIAWGLKDAAIVLLPVLFRSVTSYDPIDVIGAGAAASGFRALPFLAADIGEKRRFPYSQKRLSQVHNALENITPGRIITIKTNETEVKLKDKKSSLTPGQEAANRFVEWFKTKLSRPEATES